MDRVEEVLNRIKKGWFKNKEMRRRLLKRREEK